MAEARALAESHHFDVLLSDLQLPDGSGLDLVAELRQKLGWFCAIALTGHALPQHITASREAGFDHHLSKPFELEKLRRLLHSCMIETPSHPVSPSTQP
jgi:CheY-like chemotaxis protein